MIDKLLDYARLALFILLGMISIMLFEAWQKDHSQAEAAAVTQPADQNAANGSRFVPDTSKAATTAPAVASTPAALPASETGKQISVKTDVIELQIDTLGGDIVGSKMLEYPESLGSKQPFVLMTDDEQTRYIAESGLLGAEGPDTTSQQALYTVDQTAYELQPGQNELVVKLHWQSKPGSDAVNVTKTYTFTRGSYDVKVGYEVENLTTQPWSGNLYTQLARKDTPPAGNSGFISLATYFGAAISSSEKPFQKITFKEMKERNLEKQINGGWVAMVQHYFVSAWIPAPGTNANYYSRVLPNGLYTVGFLSPTLTAAPGQKVTTEAKLYTGPAIADKMEKAAPNLNLTIDFGWFWFISVSIFWMMQKIYDVVGNWGWSIVLVTIVIKILFYSLSAKSYRSMAALKRLQPRMEELKARYKDDKPKFTQATMDLYRTEKVNPMSGCLPILIQIPVFIALYWVLVESVQLRQAPFILWIHDLTQHDPYYILPLLMGISMFIQQRLNPPPADPVQAKVMMMMPVVFTVLFANFPAGLMLYWFVNNTLSFLQQWFVMHQIEKEVVLRQTA
jgi:YidC/Oxa1 family membrane protein insertase